MNRLVPTRPVTVLGRDFWGRRAGIVLEPSEAPGWFWRIGGADIPLTPDMLVHRRQRLNLAHDGAELHIVEHLLALRLIAGIDGVRIVSPSGWLPYDGSAEMFWRVLQPVLVEGPALTRRPIPGCFAAGGNRRVAFAEADGQFEASVAIDYPELGAATLLQQLPVRGKLGDEIIATKAPGWPPTRRRLAWLAACCGWPHYRDAVWPQEHVPAEALRLFARHRLLDLAGAFCVLCPPGGIVTGRVSSTGAGHAQDVELVHRLAAALA